MVATVASIDVTLRLLGADSFQSQMRSSGSVSEETGARVRRSMDGIAASTERAGRSASALNSSNSAINAVAFSALRAETSIAALSKGFTLLGTAVGGLAGGVAANAFRNYADTATTIANRLASVIPVQAERARIDQQIFDTAQRTRTSYESTANLFSRLALSSSQLGASQGDILKVVETTQKALQVGGATVAESASIATQLTQALGSGRLQGDELRSIAENSPVLIQAIAREFGVSVGALKDLGSNGELAADRVFKAILRAGAEVDTVFGQMTPTIANGIQQVDNAITRYIGNVDKSLGATKALTGALAFVAQNINGIGDAAALAIAAVAGPIAGRVLSGAGGRVAAPFRAAGADARAGLEAAEASAAARTAARQTAQVGLAEAEQALAAFEAQPRFRQAAPDVQRAYERQAQATDRLSERAAKAAEREAAALLKRADAESAVATVSETAANRVSSARATLAKREETLNALIAKRPELEAAAAQAGVNVSRPQQGRYYDALYRVVESRDKLAETNATIALTRRNIEALDEAIARERSAKTPSDFIPIAQARRQAEVDRLPGLIGQRDDQGRGLNEREKALIDVERRIGEGQATERERAGKRLAEIDNQISRSRASVAAGVDKVAEAEARAAQTRIAAAERVARVQVDLDAKAVAATAARRAAQEAFNEAQGRLGGLAGQVGVSAAAQRASTVEAIARAQGVLNTAYFAEQEALGNAAAASSRASAAKIALAGAANAAKGAVTGLVGLLGGPLGAALTLASVATVGYELYQARAAAAADRHSEALVRLAARMEELRKQAEKPQTQSAADRLADDRTQADALRGVRDRRNKVLDAYVGASVDAARRSGDDFGVARTNALDEAAQRLGVNLQQTVRDVRELPPASIEAAAATRTLADVLVEAARVDPRYRERALEANEFADKTLDAAKAVREANEVIAEARRRSAQVGGRTAVYDISDQDALNIRSDSLIDRAASAGRDVADAFSQNAADRIQTGTELTDALASEAEKAKTAFQAALGTIDTDTLKNALTAVGSSLDTVKANLDGTKVASGEAAAASVALAKAMDLITASRPDLSGAIAEVARYANALRTAIGLTAAVAGATLTGEDKVAAEAKQREQSLKAYEDRLQKADKSPEARRVRIGRELPGLSAAEIARLDAAENPEKAGRKAGKTKEQRNEDKLAEKLEELNQDVQVAALNDFDQKTVRFAQTAKVASDQIHAFIDAAKSGDLTNIPPTMRQIFEGIKALEGAKLARGILDDLDPWRKLARQLEELRAAAAKSPEIAANIDLIEAKLREKNAPEWITGTSSAFTDMVKSVANGSATMQSAMEAFKKKIIDLAIDAALKPIQTQISSLLSTLVGGGGAGGGLLGLFGLGRAAGGAGGDFNEIGALGDVPITFAAGGGEIRGPGTSTSDSIPAMLSDGEFVVNARAAARNMPVLRAINEQRVRHYADGGLVGADFLAHQDAALGRAVMAPALPRGLARGGGEITVNNYVSDRVEATPQRQPDGRVILDIVDKGMAGRGRQSNFARALGAPLRG